MNRDLISIKTYKDGRNFLNKTVHIIVLIWGNFGIVINLEGGRIEIHIRKIQRSMAANSHSQSKHQNRILK